MTRTSYAGRRVIATNTKFGRLDVVHVEHVAGPPKSYDALREQPPW